MDFFGAQEQARRQTRRLVFLFLLAVIGVIAALYFAALAIFAASGEAKELSLWNRDLFLTVSVVTTLFIAAGSLYKIAALSSGGGEVVAEMLGGRRVMRGTDDILEQRLLNVVDEMAIAAGVPVPKVYILDEEQGINAFAAGFTTQQAVVAVTRGTLEQLSRDELQGVVAHEFSHILNGDMRLNLRLIGILHGILLLALLGRVILENSRASRRSKNAGGIFLFALALLVIGYIGVFFGKLIKAAASRQREFLADASAVQFTRNPGGIAGALKKIGGFDSSAIHHPRAEEASHMFFGEGISSFLNLFATHPPIRERISRIDRSFKGEIKPQGGTVSPSPAIASGFAAPETVAVTPQQVMESVGTLQPRQVAYAQHLIESLPQSIRDAINKPEQARSLIYALLVVDEAHPLIALHRALVDESAAMIEMAADHVSVLKNAGRAAWLPILELVIPELDVQDGKGVEQLLANTKRLIDADGQLTLFEFLVDSLLRAALSGTPGDKGTIHRYAQKDMHEDSRMVLSMLAHLGSHDLTRAQSAFLAAITRITKDESLTLIELPALSLPRFEQALVRLSTLDYRARARLIEAATAAISHDNQITITEAELLRIIGAKLDCPIPPLLASV